jgi:hypothetical protein
VLTTRFARYGPSRYGRELRPARLFDRSQIWLRERAAALAEAAAQPVGTKAATVQEVATTVPLVVERGKPTMHTTVRIPPNDIRPAQGPVGHHNSRGIDTRKRGRWPLIRHTPDCV